MKLIILLLGFALIPGLIYATGVDQLMNAKSDMVLASAATSLLGLSLIAAHIAAPETYSWQTNTLSELGAQHYNHAWIMRAGFISFGSLVALAGMSRMMDDQSQWPTAVPVMIYGLAMAGSGLYSAPPFEAGIGFSESEARLHSLFANTAGIALTTAILAHVVTDDDPKLRALHLSAMAVVLLGSWLFKTNPEQQGIYQRALWAGGVSWLTWSFTF